MTKKTFQQANFSVCDLQLNGDIVIYGALQAEWCETTTGRGSARKTFPLNNTGMMLFFLDAVM